MTDITNPRLIKLKGILFLLVGILASALLFLEQPTVKIAVLLAIAVWCFCRFYYFAFYVIEHYVDGNYRFSGLWSFFRYLMQRQSGVEPISSARESGKSDDASASTFTTAKLNRDNYEIDAAISRVDWVRVHGWLTTSYWTPGISRERVERAARNSALVVGAYTPEGQVGFLRVVSDRTRFAYLADVWVDEAHRGHGLARAMVRFALQHPEFNSVSCWMLATADAHGVYRELGFGPLAQPERWMEFRPAKVHQGR